MSLEPWDFGLFYSSEMIFVFCEGSKTIAEELVNNYLYLTPPDDNGWTGSAAVPQVTGGHPHCRPNVVLTCPG